MPICKMTVLNGFPGFCKVGLIYSINSFDVVPVKRLQIAFDLMKLLVNNLVFITLRLLPTKITFLLF